MISVHLEAGRVEMRAAAQPGRPKGFALIRLIAGGICNTDLELQRGYYGFSGTPGHEFAGEVIEADTPSLRGETGGGRDQLGVRELFVVPAGHGPALPPPDGAGDRGPSRRFQ
jgi:alcohol dehydrogenase